MKNYRLVIREADRNVFDEIVNGQKAIETRAATNKYRKVQKGDSFTFVCGSDKLVKRVASAAHYQSLDDLYNELSLKKVLPSVETVEQAKAIHLSFPGYKAKLETYGIMAFDLE